METEDNIARGLQVSQAQSEEHPRGEAEEYFCKTSQWQVYETLERSVVLKKFKIVIGGWNSERF